MSATPKAFAVWFSQLERWSVASFTRLDWHWPRPTIRPLSDVLRRQSSSVDRAAAAVDGVQLVTLHFDGEMEARQQSGTRAIKGRLWWAEPGQVIYSKIDVRNGAIGIVPEYLGRVCVTSEYPVYAVDTAIADARYVRLLFRTETFRRKVNGMVSGASGRKRVQSADLEGLHVPLPPVSAQRTIVQIWEAQQAAAAQWRSQIASLEAQIEADFLAALGLSAPKRASLPKVFGVWWADLDRWCVMFNQLASVTVDLTAGRFPVATLGELATVSYGIQKCPANRPGLHARPYLRVANVQRGELDLREVKQINVPDADMPSLRLEAGDLVVCEGNSADLVGRPAIWRGEIPDCVHQNHILKVRVSPAHALPEYVLEYMHTAPARAHFRSRAKHTTNLASINSSDLRELAVPLPPLGTQCQLVAQVAEQRNAIARLRAYAEHQAQQAQAEIEAMILGTRPVPDAQVAA